MPLTDMNRLRNQIDLLVRATSSVPGAMATAVIVEHTAVLKAILASDPNTAEQAARSHVRRSLLLHGRHLRRHCRTYRER